MHEFDQIFLSWRHGQGNRRYIVGVIQQNSDNKYIFSYFPDVVEKAFVDGFTPYYDFPDVDVKYNGNTLEIFAQRLTKAERPDIQSFYEFWDIKPEYQNDKFYLLGHTQGLMPNDNFEFLADYKPVDNLSFTTELAGLSTLKLPSDTLKVDDILSFKAERDNEFDPDAVQIFKNDLLVGYIKKIHCRVFHKPGSESLKLKVKAIEKNGIIKRVFVKVFK